MGVVARRGVVAMGFGSEERRKRAEKMKNNERERESKRESVGIVYNKKYERERIK